MTADDFRKMALGLPHAVERAHMNHPDFRVDGKIFATLGAPDEHWGMVKLTPDQQQAFGRLAPGVFTPCQGAWGRRGCTYVRLAPADQHIVKIALAAAYNNVTSPPGRPKSPPALLAGRESSGRGRQPGPRAARR